MTSNATLSVDRSPIAHKQRNKPIVPFWCGGVSAMAASCFTHPLDLIKVHLQTNTTRTRRSALKALSHVVRVSGPRGLYSGLSAALLRQGTYTMARFAVYDLAKAKLQATCDSPTGLTLAVSSVLSGIAGGVIGNPGEILNVRMQNDQALPKELRRNYGNAVRGLYVMLKDEGVRSLAIGLGPSLLRAVLASASQLVTYDRVKERLLASGCEDGVGVHFASSFVAGIVATTVCSPADVIKSRAMAALARNGGRRAQGVLEVARGIARNEGAMAFFKGWVPSYVRLCPQLVITFVIYEKLKAAYYHSH